MRIALVSMVVFVALGVVLGISADTGALPPPLQTDNSNYTWPGSKTLQVSPDPWGTGYIVSTTAYINCPLACIRSFDLNAPVVLTAYPSSGYHLTGWETAAHGQAPSGVVCQGLPTCSFTMDGNRDVVAQFSPDVKTPHDPNGGGGGSGGGEGGSRTLTVTMTTFDPGDNVTSDPAGIDCAISQGRDVAVCTASFPKDTDVELTASGGTRRSPFNGWGGDCSGSGGCSVVMSKNRSVTASFGGD